MNKFICCVLLAAVSCPAAMPKTYKGSASKSVRGSAAKHKTKDNLNANPTFRAALVDFGKNDYADALKKFQQLDGSGHCCDTIHYYIAQCYQNTNQTVAAQQHYDWVLEKSKNPTLRSYAEYANQTLAYYSAHRTYSGQGNGFDRGGSGGSAPRRIGFS